jgi:hypothetical protein
VQICTCRHRSPIAACILGGLVSAAVGIPLATGLRRFSSGRTGAATSSDLGLLRRQRGKQHLRFFDLLEFRRWRKAFERGGPATPPDADYLNLNQLNSSALSRQLVEQGLGLLQVERVAIDRSKKVASLTPFLGHARASVELERKHRGTLMRPRRYPAKRPSASRTRRSRAMSLSPHRRHRRDRRARGHRRSRAAHESASASRPRGRVARA